MNEVIIAAAGGGKTTRIVRAALGSPLERSAIVTYTHNNVGEITKKLYELNRSLPPQAEVWSWYSFILRELARPYQSAMINGRINGIFWNQKRSTRFARQTDIDHFYFNREKLIYSDKIAQFICVCNKASDGAILARLEQRFDHIYIDEIQDLAGYDLDLIELLLRSRIRMTLVGDHRQATFRTNNAARNSRYGGMNIANKFREWSKVKLCTISYEVETHRCNQHIADVADSFFPQEPRTKSLNKSTTGHDGVFTIARSQVSSYIAKYQPQVLRLDIKTDCEGHSAMNFGESKGLTFDRVLIFPHKLAVKWLSTGLLTHVEKSSSKMYVGVSRARHSVAFVHDGLIGVKGITRHRNK
jgi:DNA helicase II / ATP-dependent DNA helicase PcrA